VGRCDEAARRTRKKALTLVRLPAAYR